MTCRGGSVCCTTPVRLRKRETLFASREQHASWREGTLLRVRALLCLCVSVNVLWLANIKCHLCSFFFNAPNICDCCKTASVPPRERPRVTTHTPLLPFALLPSHCSPPCLQSGPYQPRSLISIAGLWNTGPVVDMLTSYPTGADKLLASLSVQSEDSQPARQQNTKLCCWTWDHLSWSAPRQWCWREMWERRDPAVRQRGRPVRLEPSVVV